MEAAHQTWLPFLSGVPLLLRLQLYQQRTEGVVGPRMRWDLHLDEAVAGLLPISSVV